MAPSAVEINLCVIIPTYNNANTVGNVVEGVLHKCSNVIVVNDGCTDSTEKILSEFGSAIHIVSYSRNRGKGYALVQGFKKAKELGFTHAITIDADGQHFTEDIDLFIEKIKSSPESIIVGGRNLKEKNMPSKNSFANKFSNFWFTLQTGRKLSDTQSGYRCYPIARLKGLNLITSRYEAELELLVYAHWCGVKIEEISILNTFLCLGALLFGYPAKLLRGLKRAAYTIFSFLCFIVMSIELTIRGFFILTIGGATQKNKLRYHQILCRRAKFVVNHIPGTTYEFTNESGEKFETPCVIISNHQSHLDLMAIMMLTPKLIILTKKWVWRNPFYGAIIRYADYFPVTESDTMNEHIKRKVENGYSVVIFPEGTRSPDCRIQRFHRGAFYMAKEFGLDITPVFINGFGQVLPKKSFYLRKGKLSMEVMQRVKRENLEEDWRETCRSFHLLYKNKMNEKVRCNR